MAFTPLFHTTGQVPTFHRWTVDDDDDDGQLVSINL